MKFSLARLDSVLDQQKIAGATITRIRLTAASSELISQEIAGRDGPQIETVKVDDHVINTYLGTPIGVDKNLKPGLYCMLDMERRVP
jgi:hypothetical protein